MVDTGCPACFNIILEVLFQGRGIAAPHIVVLLPGKIFGYTRRVVSKSDFHSSKNSGIP